MYPTLVPPGGEGDQLDGRHKIAQGGEFAGIGRNSAAQPFQIPLEQGPT